MKKLIFSLILVGIMLLSACAKQASNSSTVSPSETQVTVIEGEISSDASDVSEGLQSDEVSFSFGSNNVNMNFHEQKMVTDGEYLYALCPEQGGIFKCDISKSKRLNADTAVSEDGADRIYDLVSMPITIAALGTNGDDLILVYYRDQLDKDLNYTAVLERSATTGEKLPYKHETFDEFEMSSYTDCNILGDWCYYETITIGTDNQMSGTFQRRSITDGSVQMIAEYSGYLGKDGYVFGEDRLYYTLYEKNQDTGVGEYNLYEMDYSTGESKRFALDDAERVVGCYDGKVYYLTYIERGENSFAHQVLERAPIDGGTSELVLDWMNSGGIDFEFNFSEDGLYLYWGYSILYEIPWDQIGQGRTDYPYMDLSRYNETYNANFADSGIWLWNGNVWASINPNDTYNLLMVVEGFEIHS